MNDIANQLEELKDVCAEAYQVVGSLASDLGVFNHSKVQKVLDNLSLEKLSHHDVLPWPSFKDQNLQYATTIAHNLWSKYYREIAPHWKPLDDLCGVLTQIDNMTSGLTKP